MEQLYHIERETLAGGLPPAGKPAGKKTGVRIFTVTLLLLAVMSLALAAYLGLSLRRAQGELAQLRQSHTQPPPELLPPVGSGENGPDQGDRSDEGDSPDQGDSSEEGDSPEETAPRPEPERPAYQDLYPELYAQPHQWNSAAEDKVAYLTFDDGPSARTPEVLEILDRYGVKGTFFVVGKDTEQARQWMRDIVAAGHTIGVHSYTHDYEKVYHSVEDYLDDFAQMYDLILEATGTAPQIFRFPGGSINAYNGATYQEIVSEMTRRGFVYYDWNRMTGDAVRRTPSAAVLAQNALSDIKGADRIILLAHDSKRYTNMVEALPPIIEGYQRAGFSLEALTPEVRPIVYAYPYPK